MILSDIQADQLLRLAVDAQITTYVAVAASTILVFDCLVCLDREVEMVWKRPKSLVKWLYIWNRYFALSMTWSTFGECLRICQQIQGTGATIIVGTVDIILLLRVWILYERSTRMLYTLLAMIIGEREILSAQPLVRVLTIPVLVKAEVATMLYISISTVNNLTEYVHVGFIGGCYASQGADRAFDSNGDNFLDHLCRSSQIFPIFPVPSLLVSFSMLCLTIHNCQRRITVSRSYHTHSIAVVFLRDGVLWFLAVYIPWQSSTPPQIFLWALGRASLFQVLMMPSFATYSVVGARVLLNMMEIAAERPVQTGLKPRLRHRPV
ncbi:hypothetical protein B0H11DRAFT_2206898 [Mycena galericulata]|nr:hypothetical protein B0H11DRAFT_2206898 [Mycena galericulata]